MKKIILINIISIVSIFLFIEFSIRILSNITVHGIAEGIIDESIKPKFNFPNVPGYKVFGKKVFTDDKGFRIVENKLNTNKSLKKIYFIGGSVTFGSGVKQEDTFSGLFGEKNKNLDVHNASVIGSNLSNNSDILKSKIKTSNLEKVYINLSLDDIVENQDLIQGDSSGLNDNNTFVKKLKTNIFIQKTNKFIRTKSVTWVWLKGVFLNSVDKYYKYALNSFKDEKNLVYLDKNLSVISEFNKIHENKIVFLIIPYSQQINKKNCNKKDLAEKEIIKSLNKNKLKYIFVKKIFCKNKDKDKIFFKHDPSHLSPYGHLLLANLLIKELN